MTMNSDAPLPIDTWSSDMQAAIRQICDIGAQTLQRHRQASSKAAAVADQWRLESRLEDERQALRQLHDGARLVITAVDTSRRLVHSEGVSDAARHRTMRQCAETIDANLPHIEQAILTVRHSALDLLRWTQRSAYIEDSDLPAQYRSSYARLISYAPVFQPVLETMRHDLLSLVRNGDPHPDLQLLLSALTRYIAVTDSARSFVRSVAEPPLQLVFHDTDTFQDDWQKIDAEQQGRLATEFNDCCQLLLYEPAEFNRRVDSVRPPLTDGMEASLCILPIDDKRVLFTVDEDPVFEQLTITLLRVVDAGDVEDACAAMIRALYSGLSDGDEQV
jgi:hypothetical protein